MIQERNLRMKRDPEHKRRAEEHIDPVPYSACFISIGETGTASQGFLLSYLPSESLLLDSENGRDQEDLSGPVAVQIHCSLPPIEAVRKLRMLADQIEAHPSLLRSPKRDA
jgi:hypothetical protein